MLFIEKPETWEESQEALYFSVLHMTSPEVARTYLDLMDAPASNRTLLDLYRLEGIARKDLPIWEEHYAV